MNKELSKEFDLLFAAIISAEGKILDQCGKRDRIPNYGLARNLFESPETRRNLAGSIRKEGRPEMWGQGDITCCIQVNEKETFFAVWAIAGKSPGNDYARLCAAIAKIQEM
jgi:hypothetical protein